MKKEKAQIRIDFNVTDKSVYLAIEEEDKSYEIYKMSKSEFIEVLESKQKQIANEIVDLEPDHTDRLDACRDIFTDYFENIVKNIDDKLIGLDIDCDYNAIEKCLNQMEDWHLAIWKKVLMRGSSIRCLNDNNKNVKSLEEWLDIKTSYNQIIVWKNGKIDSVQVVPSSYADDYPEDEGWNQADFDWDMFGYSKKNWFALEGLTSKEYKELIKIVLFD